MDTAMPREATKKLVMIEKVLWDCGNDRHRHQTKGVADACIARQEARRQAQERLVQQGQRYLQIVGYLVEGATTKGISEQLGISRERTRQLVINSLRKALYQAGSDAVKAFRANGRQEKRSDVLKHPEFWRRLIQDQRRVE